MVSSKWNRQSYSELTKDHRGFLEHRTFISFHQAEGKLQFLCVYYGHLTLTLLIAAEGIATCSHSNASCLLISTSISVWGKLCRWDVDKYGTPADLQYVPFRFNHIKWSSFLLSEPQCALYDHLLSAALAKFNNKGNEQYIRLPGEMLLYSLANKQYAIFQWNWSASIRSPCRGKGFNFWSPPLSWWKGMMWYFSLWVWMAV